MRTVMGPATGWLALLLTLSPATRSSASGEVILAGTESSGPDLPSTWLTVILRERLTITPHNQEKLTLTGTGNDVQKAFMKFAEWEGVNEAVVELRNSQVSGSGNNPSWKRSQKRVCFWKYCI